MGTITYAQLPDKPSLRLREGSKNKSNNSSKTTLYYYLYGNEQLRYKMIQPVQLEMIIDKSDKV